jgi:hypothetical protein
VNLNPDHKVQKSWPIAGEMLKPRELVDLQSTGPLTLQDRRVFNELMDNAWGPDLGKGSHWFEIETGKLRKDKRA